MADQLQQVFQRLLQFFEQKPNGTRAEFIASVADIAAPPQASLFVDRFLLTGHHMLILDSADFDVLMQRVRNAPADRVHKAATSIFERVRQQPVFLRAAQSAKLAAMNATLEAYTQREADARTARIWIEANAPGSEELKAAALLAMDWGIAKMEEIVRAAAEEKAALEEALA